MVELAGPFFMFATLLVVSGVPKLTDPVSTTRALESIGLPPRRNLGRAVGVVEILVGVGAIAVGGRLMAGALALLYAGFAGFILIALRSNKVKSCGCFGSDDTPPSLLHLGIDLGAAAVGAVLVARPVGHILEVMGETPWAGFPFLFLVLIGTWLALIVLAILPALFAELRTLESG
jgi:uncharacterized membrane protein YphA (DoxX/SURF4 family)